MYHSLYLPYTVSVACDITSLTVFLATQTYSAASKGSVSVIVMVLVIPLAPLEVVISEYLLVELIRMDMFPSCFIQFIIGLGLPVAEQVRIALFGAVTIRSTRGSVMLGLTKRERSAKKQRINLKPSFVGDQEHITS